ncbi:response regulator [Mucilaginibacter xinganensis]|uniref:Uncharacterized protein n=1 Tax=Mucilaginibacter xinganensis TaxID=1234841 RepID=A0A223P386_9SPHI|nr:hypothetical protein [Mucilaginibacter xinganensis]ASU36536.1 hypothetical protein MuYL_4653 [Mucilaginibacter xinganensis]
MIIAFDDDAAIRKSYQETLSKMGVDIKVVECATKGEVRKALKDPNIMSQVKVLIFDLSVSKEEAESLNFDILDDIKENYKKYPIPIFIHSAFAHTVEGYDDLGTLFKIDKSHNSLENIVNKIFLFYESGFLDIFSPNGFIESEMFVQIHKAFIDQFRGDEISLIIESIKSANNENFKQRTRSVFERIAIRSLYQNLLSAKKTEASNKIEEIQINAVEHYYRRKSDFSVWTGDIFKEKGSKNSLIVITPRCDINNGNNGGKYLVCNIDPLAERNISDLSKDTKTVYNYINDNPQNTGHKYRFLIPTPSFHGGKIDLTSYSTIEENSLLGEDSNYEYCISLSDELTNDVVRKYASYMLRSGISQSDITEALYYAKVEGEKTIKVA